MKKLFIIFCVMLLASAFVSLSFAALTGKEAHEKYVYPVVRVSGGGGGSGTVVYSKQPLLESLSEDEPILLGIPLRIEDPAAYSTYILTNYHVISNAVRITEEWDSKLKKNIDVERRSIVHVEIFKYKDLSTPVGTMKIEADIVLYNKTGDMALLKLRFDEEVKFVATLPEKDNAEFYRIMDESVASGCSLGQPTIVSVGVISRVGYQLDSLPYDMSTAQIIFGNSGGAMFSGDGVYMGIPSRVAMAGWGSPITHMGLFIPIHRIYEWLEEEFYDFLYDESLNETDRLEEREKDIEAAKKDAK